MFSFKRAASQLVDDLISKESYLESKRNWFLKLSAWSVWTNPLDVRKWVITYSVALPQNTRESRINKQTWVDIEAETQVESGWIIKHRGQETCAVNRRQKHKLIEQFSLHLHAHNEIKRIFLVSLLLHFLHREEISMKLFPCVAFRGNDSRQFPLGWFDGRRWEVDRFHFRFLEFVIPIHRLNVFNCTQRTSMEFSSKQKLVLNKTVSLKSTADMSTSSSVAHANEKSGREG